MSLAIHEIVDSHIPGAAGYDQNRPLAVETQTLISSSVAANRLPRIGCGASYAEWSPRKRFHL